MMQVILLAKNGLRLKAKMVDGKYIINTRSGMPFTLTEQTVTELFHVIERPIDEEKENE